MLSIQRLCPCLRSPGLMGVGALAALTMQCVALSAQAPASPTLPIPQAVAKPKTAKPKTAKPKTAKPIKLFDGRTLKNWRVLDKIDFENHGKIQVSKGAIELAKGRPATGIVYTGKPPRINYELSFDARRVEGDDFFCGLTFPYNKQYLTLILGGWGGKATGLSNIDDMAAVENETSSFVEFKNQQWYHVRLRVTSKKIEAWVDKEQIVDLTTAGHHFSIWWEQEPARPLGFATWYSAASYRKIELKLLPEKPPADN